MIQGGKEAKQEKGPGSPASVKEEGPPYVQESGKCGTGPMVTFKPVARKMAGLGNNSRPMPPSF